MSDFGLAEGVAKSLARGGQQAAPNPTGSLSTLFTSGPEPFEVEASGQGAAAREQPAAVFAPEESSTAQAAFFVAETCFDSEDEPEGEVSWPALDEDPA